MLIISKFFLRSCHNVLFLTDNSYVEQKRKHLSVIKYLCFSFFSLILYDDERKSGISN
jgi:hypothetical protein